MERRHFFKANVKEKYILDGNKTLYISHGHRSLFRSLINIEFQFYGSNFVFSNTLSCMFGCIYVRLGKTSFKMMWWFQFQIVDKIMHQIWSIVLFLAFNHVNWYIHSFLILYNTMAKKFKVYIKEYLNYYLFWKLYSMRHKQHFLVW